MKPLNFSNILAYSDRTRPKLDRAKFARAAAGWLALAAILALYVAAWVHVWNPFTWFISGLMVFATLACWLEDRKNPLTYQAIVFIWFLFPFQLAVVYWLLEVLQ